MRHVVELGLGAADHGVSGGDAHVPGSQPHRREAQDDQPHPEEGTAERLRVVQAEDLVEPGAAHDPAPIAAASVAGARIMAR